MKAELKGGILDGLKVPVRKGDDRVAFAVKTERNPGGKSHLMFGRMDLEDVAKAPEITCIYARSERRSVEGAALFEYDARQSKLSPEHSEDPGAFVRIATPFRA